VWYLVDAGEGLSPWRHLIGWHGGKRSDARYGVSLHALVCWSSCCVGLVSTLAAFIISALEGLRGIDIGRADLRYCTLFSTSRNRH
jgi:hypothetical protein